MGVICVFFLDIDECTEGSSGCAQNCVNTYGSYKCKCGAGYSLKADGKTCSGCKKKTHTLNEKSKFNCSCQESGERFCCFSRLCVRP